MRRKLTPAQQAKSEARCERFKQLVADVAALSDEQRAAFTARVGAVITCEGHALSLHNTMLVLMQLPTASMVAGFQQWKRAGRQVKKGQTSIMIWIPTGRKNQDEGVGEQEECSDVKEALRVGAVAGSVSQPPLHRQGRPG